MDDNVINANFGGYPYQQNKDIADAIMDTICRFDGTVSLMEVVGVLRLIEHRLLTEIEIKD